MAVSDLSDADLLAALGGQQAQAAPDVEGMVRSEAQRQGVDPALALSVAKQESGLNPDAVSPAGARGVMQLMPATAQDLGVDPNDPAQNIRGGVGYLKQQLDTFGGDRRLAAAAYNAGPGAVKKYGGVPPYAETQKYVQAVAPGVQGLSDADLMAQLGQQPDGQGTPAPATPVGRIDPRQLPQKAPTVVINPETNQPYNDAQERAYAAMMQRGELDPNAPVGSAKFPRGMVANGRPSPGEWYVDANGVKQQAPGLAKDVAGGFIGGADRGSAGLLDAVLQASPLAFVGKAIGDAANISAGRAPSILPFGLASSIINRLAYRPKTTPGAYAESIGEMLPNAVTPGGIGRKAAAVVLPGVTSQAAADFAQSHGASPTGVAAARALGGVVGGLGAGITVKAPELAGEPMTLEQLKQAKRAAYQAAEDSGATIPQADAKQMLSSISDIVQSKGGASLYPTAANMVGRLKTLVKQGLTPTQLDDYRSQIYEQLMSDGGKEANIGRQIRNHIDTVLDNDPSWSAARELNARYMKAKEVTDRLDSAGLRASSTYSGGNYTNAVRQQIRPLVDPKSAQRIGNLTPDEQAAARQVVNGTFTQNRLRDASKFMNNKFVQTGLMLVTPHGVGMPLAQAAGGGLRAASDAQSELAVQRLLDLISSGGRGNPAPQLAYTPTGLEPFNAGTLLQGLRTPMPQQPRQVPKQPAR